MGGTWLPSPTPRSIYAVTHDQNPGRNFDYLFLFMTTSHVPHVSDTWLSVFYRLLRNLDIRIHILFIISGFRSTLKI